MIKQSAGILLFRVRKKMLEVLLMHPGGPFWKNKDDGAWTIPKGEFNDDEPPEQAALREFEEETGVRLRGELLALNPVVQKAGKKVLAFAMEGDLDANAINSNTFEVEWPPKSGKMRKFPEVDRAQWFSIDDARKKINSAQAALLTELAQLLKSRGL